MGEVIYIENIKQLESEYLKKQTRFLIEDLILYSFEKNDLKNFISSTQTEYLNISLPYKKQLGNKLSDYEDISELEKYFIEQLYFIFIGGCEIQKSKTFLDRLNRFYTLNYTKCQSKKQFIDISTISIVDVISMYISLPSNLSRNIKCPLHNDNSPSFHIYEKTNSFCCFGCRKSGNCINFISEIENISIKEAFKKLITLYSKN